MVILFYLLIILVPFSQSFTVGTIGNRPINLGMDTVLIGIILLLYLSKVVFQKKRIVYNQAATILLVWGGWNIFTIVVSMLFLTMNQVMVSFIVFLRWGQYIPVFFLLANGQILTRSQCQKTIIVLGISGSLAAGLALYQVYSGLNRLYFKGAPSFTIPLFRETDFAKQTGLSGFYEGSANYNVAGAYILLTLLMIAPFIIETRGRFQRVSGLALLLFLFAGIFVTASRISVIAAIIGIGVLGYLHSWRILRLILTLGGVGIVLAFSIFKDTTIVTSIIETVTYLPQVIPMVLAGYYGSAEGNIPLTVFGAAMRLVGVREALEIFFYNPVSGVGFAAYPYYAKLFAPDNYYLQLLAETGLIGAGLMVLFFVSLTKSMCNPVVRPADLYLWKYRLGIITTMIAMLIVNITGGIFYIQKVWGAFLIVYGVWYIIKRPAPLNFY